MTLNKSIALIFPGQGAQKIGMGLEFYQNSPEARAIFEKADQICANGLSKVIFEGTEERLTSTAYCQPAIFTMSVAALKAFQASAKFQGIKVQFTAGHSLGEYAALVAAGVLSFEDGLRLVQQRAALMEEATKQNQGAMAAVIGFDTAKLMEICRQTGAEVANFNSNEQVVISGQASKVTAAIEAIKAAGGQKVIPLAVSGAFHSSLMNSAAEGFATALSAVPFKSTAIPVLSNFIGQPHNHADLSRNLAGQINGSVQWVKCVEYIAQQGITQFIEIGPGKVLKGLIRRINPALTVTNIEKPQDIDALSI